MKNILFLLILILIISCKKEIEHTTDSSDYFISNLDTIEPTVDEASVDEVTSYESIFKKEDWFLIRINSPSTSTENLFNMYGIDGFDELKSKDEYWRDNDVQAIFNAEYGSEARRRFEDKYDLYNNEFIEFKSGIYQRSLTGSELLRNNDDQLRMH